MIAVILSVAKHLVRASIELEVMLILYNPAKQILRYAQNDKLLLLRNTGILQLVTTTEHSELLLRTQHLFFRTHGFFGEGDSA